MLLRSWKYLVAFVPALPLVACGPSLESACEDYCEAAREANCGSQPSECAVGCRALDDAVDECEGEYADLLECLADEGFTCNAGQPQPSVSGCIDEALDVFECGGGTVDVN